ncbi:protein transport protein Sec61 subunit beta-like [Watersipora subatra]|uniref:protein transport protein Sec61 subunit beta-like n=1 Tax=Watersipora subatra TaxID=2589382 RepID=UPI00355C522E
MAGPSASNTKVGASDSGSRAVTPRSGGTAVRQRKPAAGGSTKKSMPGGGGSAAGMWKFYSEDSPGIKVGPVPVLVMSLLFIASVFVLHIWGKYTRG